MSTDETGERTQRPTERRRREARARGEVARSSNLVAALVLLAATVGLWQLGSALVAELSSFLHASLSNVPPPTFNEEVVAANVTRATRRVGLTLLPILLITVAAASISNLVQTGFLWIPANLLPQFSRIDPQRQIGRWWKPSAWIGFGGSLFRLAVLLVVLGLFAQARLESAGPLAVGQASNMLNVTIGLAGELGVLLSVSLVVMGCVDYGYQFWRHEQSLMMTVEEVRREQRDENGDSGLKRHRREIARSRGASADVQGLNGVGPV